MQTSVEPDGCFLGNLMECAGIPTGVFFVTFWAPGDILTDERWADDLSRAIQPVRGRRLSVRVLVMRKPGGGAGHHIGNVCSRVDRAGGAEDGDGQSVSVCHRKEFA